MGKFCDDPIIEPVTKAPSSIHPNRPKRGPLRRLRRIVDFLSTFDPDQINRLLETFDPDQINRLLESVRQSEQKFEFAQRDIKSLEQCLLNVKNLGYELGHSLAQRELRKTVTEPGSSKLNSKLCTQDDFAAEWLLYWCQELRTVPYYHRKIWELCYICQVVFAEGKLSPGRRGLGFGCGEEPLPSLFAKYGVHVTATDLDQNRPEAEVWRLSRQHAAAAESLRRRDICPDEESLANIEFHPVDMNSIPHDLDGQFDFCWSACAFEHLGSLVNGLEFVENSLRTLKPGGIAVHTTEFTLDEGDTIDNHPTVLYQSRHLVEFADQTRKKGYEVVQCDFNAGSGILDRYIDLPPWTHDLYIPPQHYAHLKLSIDGFTCTSVGVIIKKPLTFS